MKSILHLGTTKWFSSWQRYRLVHPPKPFVVTASEFMIQSNLGKGRQPTESAWWLSNEKIHKRKKLATNSNSLQKNCIFFLFFFFHVTMSQSDEWNEMVHERWKKNIFFSLNYLIHWIWNRLIWSPLLRNEWWNCVLGWRSIFLLISLPSIFVHPNGLATITFNIFADTFSIFKWLFAVILSKFLCICTISFTLIDFIHFEVWFYRLLRCDLKNSTVFTPIRHHHTVLTQFRRILTVAWHPFALKTSTKGDRRYSVENTKKMSDFVACTIGNAADLTVFEPSRT